jgi:hypothetical protein
MPKNGKQSYRDQFDRFAQDHYLQTLLKTDEKAIIPTLFIDLMTCVNKIQGRAGLILAEAERDGQPAEGDVTVANTVEVMEGAVDMSNILKALMEYYELTYGDDNDHDAAGS